MVVCKPADDPVTTDRAYGAQVFYFPLRHNLSTPWLQVRFPLPLHFFNSLRLVRALKGSTVDQQHDKENLPCARVTRARIQTSFLSSGTP